MEKQTLYTTEPEIVQIPVTRTLDTKIPKRVLNLMEKWTDLGKEEDTMVLDSVSHLSQEKEWVPGSIIYPELINNIRYINKFIESVNARLPMGGYLVMCVETASKRKDRILKNYPKPLKQAIYCLDYTINRVWPKLPYLKKFYFALTKGRNRVISETEAYGRIYSCGFRLLDKISHDGKLYLLTQKVGSPDYNVDATYGPIIRLKRYGKNHKLIKVLKIRTMHPYSEYIQQYVFEQNGLQDGGKLKNDPRVSTLGRFLRKTWLDEIPMIINLIRGDLKLFGVRPLSRQYLKLYPDDFQEYRKNFKPGLIPPFYVDLPKTLEEIIESEKRYLEAYQRNPIKTDIRYFIEAWKNIIIKKVRSN